MEKRDQIFWLVLIGLIVLIVSFLMFIVKQEMTWWIGLLMVFGVGLIVFGAVLTLEESRKC